MLCFLGYYHFSPIFTASSVIISYGVHPFDICLRNPDLWYMIKIVFMVTYVFSSMIISNIFYQCFLYPIFSYFSHFLKRHSLFCFIKKFFHHNSILDVSPNVTYEKPLQLYVGESVRESKSIYLPEKSLYQNILITGTIGTGKTSSAMYPFTEQFIAYQTKIPMLILDVKGNYYLKVKELCEKYHRTEDLIVLELDRKV